MIVAWEASCSAGRGRGRTDSVWRRQKRNPLYLTFELRAQNME